MAKIQINVDDYIAEVQGRGSGGNFPYIGLTMDVYEDDVFDQIKYEVDKQKIVDLFLETGLDHLGDLDKDEILDKIGVEYIKDYFDLKEVDE